TAVPRARHAEPARDGRDVSAARGATRSLLLQTQGLLSRRSGDARDPGAHDDRDADNGDARPGRRADSRNAALSPFRSHRPPGAGVRRPPHDGIASRVAVRDGTGQTIRALWREPARGAGAGPRRKDPGAHAWTRVRVRR